MSSESNFEGYSWELYPFLWLRLKQNDKYMYFITLDFSFSQQCQILFNDTIVWTNLSANLGSVKRSLFWFWLNFEVSRVWGIKSWQLWTCLMILKFSSFLWNISRPWYDKVCEFILHYGTCINCHMSCIVMQGIVCCLLPSLCIPNFDVE